MKLECRGYYIVEQVTVYGNGRVEVTPFKRPAYDKDMLEKLLCPGIDCGDEHVFLGLGISAKGAPR